MTATRHALAAAVLLTSAALAPAQDRPNILFIYTDDHSHRAVSCYPEAYPFVKTPNLDRLAKQGVRFAGAYNGSWCAPCACARRARSSRISSSARLIGLSSSGLWLTSFKTRSRLSNLSIQPAAALRPRHRRDVPPALAEHPSHCGP